MEGKREEKEEGTEEEGGRRKEGEGRPYAGPDAEMSLSNPSILSLPLVLPFLHFTAPRQISSSSVIPTSTGC